MKYRVIVRSRAESDIADAAGWYEGQRPTLGQEFVDEALRIIRRAADNPLQFARVRQAPEVRRALGNRFPYAVYFLRYANAIVIFRILHTSRHDREWKSHVADE